MKVRSIGITVGLTAALLVTGCGSTQESNSGSNATGSISEQVDYKIIGIEPGAGLTGLAHTTLEEYENLEGWELEESSTAGMLTLLGQAIENEEPIVVTGWAPHYKFAQYDLKFIEDPKGTLGDIESIHTMARSGFEEDMPNAYKILDAFEWDLEDMETVTYEAQNSSFEEASTNWIEANQDKVNTWIEGSEQVDGEKIDMVSSPWDTERASSQIIKMVLEQQGYNVTVSDVDPAILFQALANGEADVSVAPWLPVTHGAFYEKHQDELLDLGPNLTGAQNGFVVPEYMDIDSIEDLEPKE
ncbi:glycine/betaine ABC transporter [Desemzia sp. RIT804]|uniref:glycine betaine ABC transporter substrate-binding protein n=1 Tax=Desemzia sp. RIT 804 TaxID=2810209 RepID=UPI001952316C|nr:glycine betaine ABC transporter substrate-binding protein [Desemzia sp. RIT 804]MBM6615870.1 glycine/betaine ABC transporter [Desemzia sp. RIT 804]